MVGDGKSKKGLLDADKFKGTFEKFAQTTGGFLERVFKGENLAGLQDEIKDSLSNAFDFKNLNQGNSIVGKLMKTSGELIGQMLKAFAAFGPGLVNTVMDSFDSLVDFLWNYKSKERGDNSVVGILMDLFKINKEEGDIITDSFKAIIDRITSSGGPLLYFIGWLNSKFVGLMVDAFSTISGAIYDALFGYDSIFYQALKAHPYLRLIDYAVKAVTGVTSIFGLNDSSVGLFDSNTDILDKTALKNTGVGLESLQLNKIASDERYDEGQMEGLGKITAALKTELARQKSVGDTKSAADITSILEKISNKKDSFFGSLDSDEFVQGIARDVAKYQGITLNIDQVEDDVTSITGRNGIGIIKRTGKNKAIIKQTAVGDQTVTGKEGGPVVDAISYAGDAANALIRGMEYIMSPSNLLPSMAAQTSGPSEITIRLEVDGNTLTEVVLDNDIIRKATQVKNGRTTLGDGTVVDASGNSIQSSSMIG
jgi:hypothetical protein